MHLPHQRIPVATDDSPELASLQVEFDWHFVGKIKLLSESPFQLQLPEVRYPGVYRLTASVRGGTVEDDVWYVGQSMDSIDARIRCHLREEFDEQTSKGKRFLARLRAADGWCQLEEAQNIRLDGRSELVRLKDGRFDAEAIATLPLGWLSTAQFIMNVIESTGQVTSEMLANPQGKRCPRWLVPDAPSGRSDGSRTHRRSVPRSAGQGRTRTRALGIPDVRLAGAYRTAHWAGRVRRRSAPRDAIVPCDVNQRVTEVAIGFGLGSRASKDACGWCASSA